MSNGQLPDFLGLLNYLVVQQSVVLPNNPQFVYISFDEIIHGIDRGQHSEEPIEFEVDLVEDADIHLVQKVCHAFLLLLGLPTITVYHSGSWWLVYEVLPRYRS